jgi:hypothetical protein
MNKLVSASFERGRKIRRRERISEYAEEKIDTSIDENIDRYATQKGFPIFIKCRCNECYKETKKETILRHFIEAYGEINMQIYTCLRCGDRICFKDTKESAAVLMKYRL